MRAAIRTAIDHAYTSTSGESTPINLYLADAKTQTNPEGKQRAAMNAFQHGLSGNRMILQEHELEAYRRLSSALHHDYSPATETERQFVQKIIDCHTRLNRIVAIENNILNVGVSKNTDPDSKNDPATEAMIAQARTWTQEANSFEKLGRYESRISRQLIQYTKELDRIQTSRCKREAEIAKLRQPSHNKPDTAKIIPFRQSPPQPGREVSVARPPIVLAPVSKETPGSRTDTHSV